MEAKAYLYDLRISPRKVSIVLDLIRNKDVATAAGIPVSYTHLDAADDIEGVGVGGGGGLI